MSQLLQHKQWLMNGLAEGSDIDIIYIDFAKAFDKVDHATLLRKIERSGVKGQLLTWLLNFLYDRKQKVAVEGTHSSAAVMESGVPQGAVLDPIMFLIYLNDLEEEVVDSRISSFANDTQLLKTIRVRADQEALQHNRENLRLGIG